MPHQVRSGPPDAPSREPRLFLGAGIVNAYDRTSSGTKWIFLLLGLFPAAAAGWLNKSWVTGALAFAAGWVTTMIIRVIVANILRSRYMRANGEVDPASGSALLWPFMIAGPAGAAIGAIVVLMWR